MSDKKHLKNLIARKTSRLQRLKEQQALRGIDTPVHILVEIESLEKEISDLDDSSHLPITNSDAIYDNLPQPDYERFVGRQAELEKIRLVLSQEHRAWVITVDGIGGIGKSALALEVAIGYLRDFAKLLETERFEAIIWTSAKQTFLTGDGIKDTLTSDRTLGDIYKKIAVTLQREDITRASPEERNDLIVKALAKQRTLLIIDNFEDVDDERIRSFIRDVPAPTKVIVTTRHRLDVAYPIRLVKMSEAEGLDLINHEAELKGVKLTSTEATRLYKRTGGVPIAIVWSIAQMSFGYEVETVLTRLSDPPEDIAKFCFETSIGEIENKPALKLLMALSLFATDADRETLGYATDLPVLDRDDGLVELEKLSLINRNAGRFSLLPLTLSYLADRLEKMPDFRQKTFERILTYYQELVNSPREVRLDNQYWDGLVYNTQENVLEREWSNLAAIIQETLALKRYDDALKLFLPAVHFLYNVGLWDERLQLSYELCRFGHELKDPVETWLWIDAIAYVLQRRDQFEECAAAIRKGRVLATKFGLEDALILADVNEAYLFVRMENIDIAQSKIEHALKHIKLDVVFNVEISRVRQIVSRRVVAAAALIRKHQKNYVAEKEWYERELELRQQIGVDLVPTLSALAGVSLRLDDIVSAEKYLTEASNAGPKNKKDLPWLYYRQALLAEKKGNLQAAKELGSLAKDEFIRSGYSKSRVEDCERLLTRLST